MPFKEGSLSGEKPDEELPKKEQTEKDPKMTRRGFLKAALGAVAGVAGTTAAYELSKKNQSVEHKTENEAILEDFSFHPTGEEALMLAGAGVMDSVKRHFRREVRAGETESISEDEVLAGHLIIAIRNNQTYLDFMPKGSPNPHHREFPIDFFGRPQREAIEDIIKPRIERMRARRQLESKRQ